MTDGTLAVRRREPKATEEAAAEAKQQSIQSGAYESFTDMEAVFGTGYVKAKGKDLSPIIAPADEYKVETRRQKKLKEFDKHLKAFKYASALDAGLKKVSEGSKWLFIPIHSGCMRLMIISACPTCYFLCACSGASIPRCTPNSTPRARRDLS